MSGEGSGCDREALLGHLQECGAIAFGEFTLASGKKSDYYVNIKKAYTDPGALRRITACFASMAAGDGKEYDVIAGMELGAVPLMVALALKLDLRFVIVRKDPKGHGMKERLIGDLREGARVLMVEDVTTTAGSVVKAAEVLREAGAAVEDVLIVVDRQEGSGEALEAAGLRPLPILTADAIRHKG
jgi:orotate phosphoribosyltransferase